MKFEVHRASRPRARGPRRTSRAHRLARSSSATVAPQAERMHDPRGVPPGSACAGGAHARPHHPGGTPRAVTGRARSCRRRGPKKRGNRLVRERVRVLGRPVVPLAGRIVEHALKTRVRRLRRSSLPRGRGRAWRRPSPARFGLRSGEDHEDRDASRPRMRGHERLGGTRQEDGAPAKPRRVPAP